MALNKIGKEGITGISNSSDATAITIDSSERVNIGTGTPPTADSVLSVQKSSAANEFNVISSPSHASVVNLGDTDDYNICRIKADNSDNSLQFQTNNSERMRIDSSGSALFFCTSEPSASVSGACFTNNQGELRFGVSGTGNSTRVRFFNPNGEVGAIRTSGSATNYETSSDHRLKENVTADWNATTRLKQLNPVRFNFIADADTTVDGFLAHEAQEVVPEAVVGEKDAVDDDGNPIYQGIDQSKLVPLLVKTIQELEARITALENA
jgi:hypothetical protein